MRTQPKVKMYIEIKPGQEDKIKQKTYPGLRHHIILPDGTKIQIRGYPKQKRTLGNLADELRNTYGLCVTSERKETTAKYIKPRGHKLERLGKSDIVLPIRGHTLDAVLVEVKETEEELRRLGIRYERKCTWVCGM